MRRLAIAFLLLAVSSATVGQDQDRLKPEVKAFPIRLLPGYRVQPVPGIDTWGATISKTGSATVELFGGLGFGIAADSVDKTNVAWRHEQVVNGERLICVYTKSDDLIVSIPHLAVNFQGHVQNQEDLAEMLLMVLTYEPIHGYPVDPGTVAPLPESPK